ncbi:Serine/threonine-protein kinase haspin-like [Vitis vinifera]|uniref:non-specific serine/threonine protein kinase n=1 Tax=Vitis vinifera TaxID=29760 RepID=A0A438GYW2_VITVI|nr:Serine/threonine-protein kinase haspin-like [Vitis vinifera]
MGCGHLHWQWARSIGPGYTWANTLNRLAHSDSMPFYGSLRRLSPMTYPYGQDSVDLWSEIAATEEGEGNRKQQIAVIYRRRRRTENTLKDVDTNQSSLNNGNRLSLAAPVKRVSWNRSLSIRGRTSIAVFACVEYQPQQRKPRRKAKPPLPRGKFVQPQSFEQERAYFQEVDAYELLEESPSPKRFGTWAMGVQSDDIVLPHLSSVLNKWLIAKKLNYSYGPSGSLSKILETPAMPMEPICGDGFDASTVKTPEKASPQVCLGLHSVQDRFNSDFMNKDVVGRQTGSQKSNEVSLTTGDEGCEDIDVAIKKLSLTSSDPESIVKIGEGTYGEAFRAGKTVCKIVPIDGDLLVNGEVQKLSDVELASIHQDTYWVACFEETPISQAPAFISFGLLVTLYSILDDNWFYEEKYEMYTKRVDLFSVHILCVYARSGELLEEAILSRTLNHLREDGGRVNNSCTSFIETLECLKGVTYVPRPLLPLCLEASLRVCQGPYDAALIRAWEDWDEQHGSENDHPREFPEKQCYVVFVLEHGGKDLESFVLLNFDEVRSLLVQVTVALAVAEAAYEFEHRDLHWGNILLSRKDSEMLQFTLEGKNMFVKTFGLSISIIDFTLSRINTGEAILFLDLSSDPELFKGPKGDNRKMKEITEDFWEGSFPKTNVLWLQYLVDILLLKKSFKRTSKDERELRSLKKRMDNYGSAKEATSDPFFTDMFVDHAI